MILRRAIRIAIYIPAMFASASDWGPNGNRAAGGTEILPLSLR